MMNHVVISVSGGMDSTALLLRLLEEGRTVYALSFFYGQKHQMELERLDKNISFLTQKGFPITHNRVDLSSVMSLYHSALIDPNYEVPEGHYEDDNMKQTVVPNRNAIFSSLIFGYALSIATKEQSDVDIALGVHSGDHAIYPDCRPEFYEVLLNAFKEGNWESERVSSYLPYLYENKHTILQDSLNRLPNLGLTMEDFNTIFANTNTCYKPDAGGRSCGKCGSCTERLEAFAELGIADPVKYI